MNEAYCVAPSFPDDSWNTLLEKKTFPLVMFPQGLCCRKIVCMWGGGGEDGFTSQVEIFVFLNLASPRDTRHGVLL